jgi:hypothetical protein
MPVVPSLSLRLFSCCPISLSLRLFKITGIGCLRMRQKALSLLQHIAPRLLFLSRIAPTYSSSSLLPIPIRTNRPLLGETETTRSEGHWAPASTTTSWFPSEARRCLSSPSVGTRETTGAKSKRWINCSNRTRME